MFDHLETQLYLTLANSEDADEMLCYDCKCCCYMTPMKDLLWLAETSFHLLWLILMFTSDELNIAQDR